MSDSKPFSCGHAGCAMAFANEDHLSVHKNKHGLKLLQFDLTSADGTSKALPFTDQTPTPTKFFRIEEGHLFEEISTDGSSAPVNPFEDQFRKAAASSSAKLNSEGCASNTADAGNSDSAANVGDDADVANTAVAPPSATSSDAAVDEPAIVNSDDSDTVGKVLKQNTVSRKAAVPRLKLNLKVGEPNDQNYRPLSTPQTSPCQTKNKMYLQGPQNELIPVAVKARSQAEERVGSPAKFESPPIDDVCVRKAPKRKKSDQGPISLPILAAPQLQPLSDSEEPDDDSSKREFLLARNREAASRSRKKKKVFITELEQHCSDLAIERETLRLEVHNLRKELASVKELLKEHVVAGCEVALNQVLHGRVPPDVANHCNHRFVLVNGEGAVSPATTPVTLLLYPS